MLWRLGAKVNVRAEAATGVADAATGVAETVTGVAEAVTNGAEDTARSSLLATPSVEPADAIVVISCEG